MRMAYPSPVEDTSRALNDDRELVGTVGHECEFASGNLAPWLHDHDHAPDTSLHGYQCRCSQANQYLIHPTSDGTARGGEYVIGGGHGVLFGSDTYIAATDAMAEAIVENRPEVDDHVGMHTHVGTAKRNGRGMTTTESRRLVRNYLALQDQILVLAAGAFHAVRDNGCTASTLQERSFMHGYAPSEFWKMPVRNLDFPLPGRPTLNFHSGNPTVEFRVWNAVRSQWRMVLAAGVSVALVEAACQQRDVPGPGTTDLLDHLDGLLTPDVIQLVHRQREFHKSVNGAYREHA